MDGGVMTGQQVATLTPAQTLAATVRSKDFLGQVEQALPGGLLPERFVRAAATAINQNPDIATCERGSVFTSLLRCAQDGLLPDGREAALVKFKDKAQYMPMIGGFRKIAAESGWAIDTQVVYANDEFDYRLGLEPGLIHKPPSLGGERGAAIGAYAVCTHSDGRKQVEVMGRSEIEKVRKISRSKDKPESPWQQWPERMWEKTVGRRAFAKLPLGGRDEERIKRVLEASDDEYELTPAEHPVAASLTPALPVQDGPDDSPIEGEVVEEQAVDEAGQTSFAEMAERAQRTGRGGKAAS